MINKHNSKLLLKYLAQKIWEEALPEYEGDSSGDTDPIQSNKDFNRGLQEAISVIEKENHD